jgi:hypothetical protein
MSVTSRGRDRASDRRGPPDPVTAALRVEELGPIRHVIVKRGVEPDANLRSNGRVLDIADHARSDAADLDLLCRRRMRLGLLTTTVSALGATIESATNCADLRRVGQAMSPAVEV